MKETVSDERASVAAWYGLGVLFIAYTFSFIDRTILSLLVEPVKTALSLNDTQVSLLHGFAFAIFYTFLGIPIARLADRLSRRRIITIGIVIWSLMTAACGLANRFATLFVARVGVGVGEAALSPAAYSMIADSFPRRDLGLALGLYSTGVYVGAGVAFMIGGYVVQAALDAGAQTFVLIGVVEPWQLIFFVVGLPGLGVALLMMTVNEPTRRHQPRLDAKYDLLAVFSFLGTERRAFFSHFCGYALLGLVFNSFLAWAPTYFIRTYGMTAGEVGPFLGALILVFGGLGITLGGLWGDRLLQRGDRSGPLLASSVAGLLLLPVCIAVAVVNTIAGALFVFAAFFFLAAFPYGSAAAAIQIASPPQLRAQVSAIYLFILNLAGIGLGPTIIAVLTDFLFVDASKVGLSMAIVGAVAAPLGAVVLGLGRPAFASSVVKREAEEMEAAHAP